MITEKERAATAAGNHGSPTLDFGRATPYDEYVGTAVLHGLQRTVTDVPEERVFLVTTQVMELYFGLLRAEWRLAQRHLDGDDVTGATATLRRSVCHFEPLNAAWASLGRLTPQRFNLFRDQLGEASGFQSAMYRHVEFLLGNKSEPLTRPHRSVPGAYRELTEALAAPSLYDTALALLARHGYPVPAAVLERDLTAAYRPGAEVEAAWRAVYERGELVELAETLVDVAGRFAEWKHRHLLAVRRSMGAKPGSGGSSGLAWLERSLAREVFPELWTARTAM
ncbi:tryptophan 2,3-dioxygenase [Microtetraspora sp. NBRC 13810]|uniref:tryptophan 2,3-dioxygenase n=1 Tax=Microtetraspora sp. NBRC 13810 TaxID=3030990 RepID=UPI0024A28872|nr:tryptophan 2,3-dioxygenase family protein [Microtetraspora sp. NBRC 13810]GLW10959.1 tryptophan 2,3-dioxygenase [Microtetraspora sp. NBRC 13810]